MGRHLARQAQRRGANCAVSGGYTALNRITDVMRVASPRITQRLCAIGPPRGQAVRKETRDAACGRASDAAGASASRRAELLAGHSQAAPVCAGVSAPPLPQGPAPSAGRALRRSAAPAAVGAP